jgi:hypothetical protein
VPLKVESEAFEGERLEVERVRLCCQRGSGADESEHRDRAYEEKRTFGHGAILRRFCREASRK